MYGSGRVQGEARNGRRVDAASAVGAEYSAVPHLTDHCRQWEVQESLKGRLENTVERDVHIIRILTALRTHRKSRKPQVMLSHCANTECRKPFLRLREGKLFLVETDRLHKPGQTAVPPFVRARQQPRQAEHFWLCDECATHWTLIYDRENGVALAPLRRAPASAPNANAASAGTGQTGVA